ncbi:hypothetical protein C8R42DRAFT_682884 [Lentinula raphanica]|nr:hypothetical protein C8R42DRAFT_682884 [Lentinula raphanica]
MAVAVAMSLTVTMSTAATTLTLRMLGPGTPRFLHIATARSCVVVGTNGSTSVTSFGMLDGSSNGRKGTGGDESSDD